jgi:predicted Zn-dependent peptidase
MKKIKLNNMDEVIYYEKLSNGLDIYLYNKEEVTNNYVTFTTKFGSIYNEFIPFEKNKMIKVPHGVAHFLEHKVFAQEEGMQPEEFFAQSGTICNAYTTFKNTTYLFSGPNDLKKNINFLLDYVQSPYFTEENVNSEKGIITQEIHMCDDNPSDVMYEHIRKNIFHNNPFKDSIIGTVKDIKSINVDTLFACYNTFYHPQNMFLVVTGNFNPKEILRTIEENQKKKKYKLNKNKLEIKEYKEKDTVVKAKEIIKHNTEISKVSYNIKISLKDIEVSKRKYNIYLFIIFSILFDDSSIFDEEAKEESIISNSLYINILNCDTHTLVSLINETNSYEKLIDLIDKRLENIEISSEDLERKKRVLISNELFSFENLEVINEMIIDNIIFDNHIEENMIDLIKSLNKQELDKLISKLNLANKAVVILESDT